jgi:hypothetical protein
VGRLLARSWEKEAGGLLRFGPGKKKKKQVGWAKGERRRGRRGLGFSFLNSFQIHFSNFSNSTQTRNHAFES